MDVYRALVFFLCCLSIQASHADVYKWTDEKGRVHFSDQPPPSQPTADIRENQTKNLKADSGIDSSDPTPKHSLQANTSPDRPTNTGSIILTLRELLQKRRFAELNRILHEYETAFASDVAKEENLFTAYHAFDVSDTSYQPLFQAWIQATPDSYQPYLARAHYAYRQGWLSRGTKWASETKEKRIEEMNAYFSDAIRDIEKSLGINRRSIVSYSLLLRIAQTQGRDGCKLLAVPANNDSERDTLIREFKAGLRTQKDECIVLLVLNAQHIEQWTVAGFDDKEAFQRESSKGPDEELTRKLKKEPVDEIRITQLATARLGRTYEESDTRNALNAALQISPATYRVRVNYMNSLTPRWGGSYQAMQAFAQQSLKYAARNPKLRMLEGLIYADAADMQALLKKYSDADALYTKALAYGDNHVILMKRGENNYRRENYEAALTDLDHAISRYQEDGDYYYWRSKTYSMLEHYDKAMTDIERADRLKPGDPDIERQRQWLVSTFTRLGYELNRNRKGDAALEKFTAALRLEPDNAELYYWRARAYLIKNRLDSAYLDLQKAIELDATKFDYYRLIDWVLAKHHDWKQIIAYWDRYITLSPDDDRAYVERGGAYYHMGNMKAAVHNAKIAADMGNHEGREAYEKFKHLVR